MERICTFEAPRGMYGLATTTWHMGRVGGLREGGWVGGGWNTSVALLEGQERKVRAGRTPHNISWSPFRVSTSRKATFFPNVYITFNYIGMLYFNIIYHLPMSGHLSCSDVLL